MYFGRNEVVANQVGCNGGYVIFKRVHYNINIVFIQRLELILLLDCSLFYTVLSVSGLIMVWEWSGPEAMRSTRTRPC